MTLELDQLTSFVLEHHPLAWTWGEERTRNWVDWFTRHGCIISVSENLQQIDGLVLFRTVMKAEDGVGNTLNHDPEGPVIFVDFLYAPTERARRGIVTAAIHQIGSRPFVAWERRHFLHTWPSWRLVNHILKREKEYEQRATTT